MSILKKILLTIISLVVIITLVFVGVDSYDDYTRHQRINPKSEYFNFPSYYYDNGTVEVNDVRYLKKDMSLFILTTVRIPLGYLFLNPCPNPFLPIRRTLLPVRHISLK